MGRIATRFLISGLVLLLFVLHTGRVLPLRLLDTVERFAYDARVRLSQLGTVDPRIVIIDIDERSMAELGQFPWPRDRLATLVEQAFDRYGVAALGFDIAFLEPDATSGRRLLERLASAPEAAGLAPLIQRLAAETDHDRRFAEAMRGRPVVLGYYFSPEQRRRGTASSGQLCAPLLSPEAARLYAIDYPVAEAYSANLPLLQSAAADCGFFDNATLDDDGVYRQVPLLQAFDGAVYGSLALNLTRLALGGPPLGFVFDPPEIRDSLHLEAVTLGELRIPVDGRAAALVPYRGPSGSFPYVSAADVIAGRADAEVMQGRIGLVGTSAPGLYDLRVTPISQAFVGVEVHANLISGFLDGRIRQRAPYYDGIEISLLVLITVLMAWGLSRLSPLAGASLTLGLMAAVTGLAWGLWQSALFVMPLGVPIAFILLLFLLLTLYGYFIESRGKREISRLFGQYVPPELVEELAAHPEALSMAGESREMTVLFSDVRGFTQVSEQLDARALAELMNRFLSRQTAVIHDYRGTIDKYMGDAVMAFWGAPLPDPQHALHAVEAGLAMLRAVRELDAEFAEKGWPRLEIGVGISTGRMNVGNMGSSFRMAYTVMGDAVNLGSRLEGLTKVYGVGLIVAEATRLAAPPEWSFRELDAVRVKGKQQAVAIYEPLGPKEALDPALRQEVARHRGALQLYRAQDWRRADAEFAALAAEHPERRVYALFRERIARLQARPPGPGWDGSFVFETK
jgi:adenylate cyclase